MNEVATQTKFKGEILRQVYRVWLWRKFLPVLIIEIAVFGFILYSLGRIVFVQRILENAFTAFFLNPFRIFPFITSAFVSASLATKIFTLIAALLLAVLIRHLTQGLLRLFLVRENYFSRVQSSREN